MRVLRNAWFRKFARKHRLDTQSLLDAVERAEVGSIDAQLGDGLIKQRVARRGGGRSGGYRTIIFFRAARRAVFVFGFAKKDRESLTGDELTAFRKAAKLVLSFTDAEIEAEVATGRLMDVMSDDDL